MIARTAMKEELNRARMALALRIESEFMEAVKSAIEFGATASDLSKALNLSKEQGEKLIELMKPFMK